MFSWYFSRRCYTVTQEDQIQGKDRRADQILPDEMSREHTVYVTDTPVHTWTPVSAPSDLKAHI